MSATDTASSRPFRLSLWRYTLLAHRWVGIAVGAIIFLWCVSGIVMMYVQYPSLENAEQLVALEELNIAACCDSTPTAAANRFVEGDFFVEMDGGRPVLRLEYVSSGYGDYGGQEVIDLKSARRVEKREESALQQNGVNYAIARGWDEPVTIGWVDVDQWTVHARFNPHRPMLKFSNTARNEWYVASTTGQIVQVTSRTERFWNWLGAIPHWLYFTVLRQNTAAWAQTVIWLTLVGLFLTVTGVVVGIKQYRWRASERKSPYRNWMLWHHYMGLLFGVFTLTWLLSGLFSMNPWGALESRSFATEREQLNGVQHSLGELYEVLQSVGSHMPAGTVRLESAYWLGQPYFLALNKEGKATRLSPAGVAGYLTEEDLRKAMPETGLGGASVARIDNEDTYYFGHHVPVELPVYRITTVMNERLYLSALTGRLLQGFDNNARTYRWLFSALHSGDFHEIVRRRPVWDVMMLLLLIGVTIGTGTGTWLGIRYVTGNRHKRRA